MIKFEPLETVTVNVDGKDYTIYRDEMERNPLLCNILSSYDRLTQDLIEAEYEREKLMNAKFSLGTRLSAEVSKYIEEKLNADEKEI